MDASLIFKEFTVNAIIVSIAVLVHFELLNLLTLWAPKIPVEKRGKLIFLVFGLLWGHIIEIWLFAFGFFISVNYLNLGNLEGQHQIGLMDYTYFSTVTYTSLGFGDLTPMGPIRFLTGMETLTGLTLISWSASFIYIEMQRYWKKSDHSL